MPQLQFRGCARKGFDCSVSGEAVARRVFTPHPDPPQTGDAGLRRGRLFNFLGFTFISGKDRRGNFQLKRKTRPCRPMVVLSQSSGTV